MLGYLPSPPSSELVLGPFHLRYYGLMIALGVIAAVWLARKRWADRGGNPDDVSSLALWCVPAGLVGARAYHVATDWDHLYSHGRWWPAAFEIWNGGLGIPGAVLLGFLVGIWYVRRRGWVPWVVMDIAAPAIPLAQSIGRWGNWFNQELFGRPTRLPWGLKIDLAHRMQNIPNQAFWQYKTFQPTFLYESLWDLGVCLVLLWMDRTGRIRRGKLFPAYVSLYFLGRMWVESLRSDWAAEVGGIRWNFLLSIILIVLGGIWFFWVESGLATVRTAGSILAQGSPKVGRSPARTAR